MDASEAEINTVRLGIACDIISIEGEMIRGSHDFYLKADRIMDENTKKDYDMVILPGGFPGAEN